MFMSIGLTSGKGVEHAQGSAGNAKHVGQAEADENADGDDQAGDDGRLVAQRQAKDDVGGGTSATRIRHFLHDRAGIIDCSSRLALMPAG